jgi:hypothetical protein
MTLSCLSVLRPMKYPTTRALAIIPTAPAPLPAMPNMLPTSSPDTTPVVVPMIRPRFRSFFTRRLEICSRGMAPSPFCMSNVSSTRRLRSILWAGRIR